MADGFAPITRDIARDDFTPTFLIAAIDAARREAAAPEPAALPAHDPLPGLLAEARAAGREEGRAEALRAAAEDRGALAARAALAAADALRDGRDAAAAAAEDVAAGLARVALAVLDAALPGLAEANAAPLAAAFARRLAPLLRTEAEARLFVAPGLGVATAALLAPDGISVEEDDGIAPGDARAEWRAGGAAFELAQRRQEIRRILQEAGLGLEG